MRCHVNFDLHHVIYLAPCYSAIQVYVLRAAAAQSALSCPGA